MGMAIGAGYVTGGIGLALLTRSVLTIAGRWELSHYADRNATTIGLIVDPDHGKTEIKIEHLLDEFSIPKSAARWTHDSEGRQRWTIQCHLTSRRTHEFLFELIQMPEVHAIER